MSKNYLLALIAGVALLAAGCGKADGTSTDTSKDPSASADPSGNPSTHPSDESQDPVDAQITAADFVGNWCSGETVAFMFKEDGTYTEIGWDKEYTGKWTFNETDSSINFLGDDGETRHVKVRLIGGKAWLVMIDEYEGDGGETLRSYSSYTKEGATVQSGILGDGRWDAPHNGNKPAAYTPDVDYRICMVVSGSDIDLYVLAWGYHIQGKFTLENGNLHIETDDDHIWSGHYVEANSISWSAWGPPTDEFEDGWDYSYGSLNPETFALQSPYQWYSVSDILNMGWNPEEHAKEYAAEPYNFKFILWETGESIRSNAMDLCDFDLCVSPDGTEAFGGAVGMTPWFYKR